MSQHRFMSKENREVMYGLDKPSGGFYVTEFLRDDEVEKTPNKLRIKKLWIMKKDLASKDLH